MSPTCYLFNPRIALLFLRTCVAFGVKSPTSLSRRTTNVFVLNDKPGVFRQWRIQRKWLWQRPTTWNSNSLCRLNRKYFIWTRHGRKPQNCRWNFDVIYHSSMLSSNIVGYFRFRPYCYFRLSVVVTITFFEFAMVEKPPVCRLKRTHLLFFYVVILTRHVFT